MATNKMIGIKLAKLKKVVDELAKTLPEQVEAQRLEQGGVQVGVLNCIYLNGALHRELLKHGFKDAKFVGGRAAYGINKTSRGVIDYGYTGNPQETMVVNTDTPPLFGHCWVEIKSLGIVVDLTVLDMKRMFKISNEVFGIYDDEFLLKVDSPIIDKKTLISWDSIYNDFAIGYNYVQTSETTEIVTFIFNAYLEECEQ